MNLKQRTATPLESCALCARRIPAGEAVALNAIGSSGEIRCCSQCHCLFAEMLAALRQANSDHLDYAGLVEAFPR